MNKKIVLCLDGTWNNPDTKDDAGDPTPTNVQKVFENLAGSAPLGPKDLEKEVLHCDADNQPLQAAKYIYGIGDVSNKLANAVAGAVGLGLVARIVRAYTYLSRVYEAGDDIYIIGFSRGAYAARALAGLVVSQGLLDWKQMNLSASSEDSYSAGLAVWENHQQNIRGDNTVLHEIASAITTLLDSVQLALHPAPPIKLIKEIKITAVGVWDTVGALGIPIDYLKNDTVGRLDVFQFVDLKLNPRVLNGFHAIAIDEMRVDFTPTIWEERDGVVQVLFPGAHADVGGGYSEKQSGLSNGPLQWMVAQLRGVGVLFGKIPGGIPDPLGIAHRPWTDSFPKYAEGYRHFPASLRLSQRVVQRVNGGAVPIENGSSSEYRPLNILNSYYKYDWNAVSPYVAVEK